MCVIPKIPFNLIIPYFPFCVVTEFCLGGLLFTLSPPLSFFHAEIKEQNLDQFPSSSFSFQIFTYTLSVIELIQDLSNMIAYYIYSILCRAEFPIVSIKFSHNYHFNFKLNCNVNWNCNFVRFPPLISKSLLKSLTKAMDLDSVMTSESDHNSQ